MKFKELQEKSKLELKKLVASNREKLRDLNFKVANKQVKNLSIRKEVRKEIARILTILNQEESKDEKS